LTQNGEIKMPDNEQPLTAWQQCKQISEALSPKAEPENVEQAKNRLRAVLLAQLTALGPEGADLATRLADTDSPIEAKESDLAVFEQLKARMAASVGSDGQAAIAIDLDMMH
jgi:hypothetical protein